MERPFISEFYTVQDAPEWARSFDEEQIIAKIVDTDFSKKQLDEGRDFCYFLNKTHLTESGRNCEFVQMAYTLNEPTNLETASAMDIVVEENEIFHLHRIKVLREGVLIDKIPNISIKVFDNENQSGGGILNSQKKINISIKDLRLYDVLIIEDSREKIYKDKDFMRKEFVKYVWVSPDNYWAYGDFRFNFINNREQDISYKKCFFRDENSELIPDEIQTLKSGENYVIHYENHLNEGDAQREIFPFIDFASQSNWIDLSNYIAPFYAEIYKKNPLESFAPDLIGKLDNIPELEDKLQFAIEFVQNNIYYVFNADEMSGHKPQDPSITYENKQGDCKAKSVLLKVILDYLKIDSTVTLVNFYSDIYLNYYLPSLLSFNHVILKINLEGETHFVDATLRDEHGWLKNRGFTYFLNYLELQENQDLQLQGAYQFQYAGIEEKVNLTIKNNIGTIDSLSIYRGNRANSMRRYFKSTSRREILDSWNSFFYYTLNYSNDRNGTDARNIFDNANIEIVSDDKKKNEFTLNYKAEITKDPYYTDSSGRRFMMFFDRNIIKSNAREFMHKDLPFWHIYDNEKYDITLQTDQNIDTTERFTVQESDIKNELFSFKSVKKINKNGGNIQIDFKPKVNVTIPLADFEPFRKDHNEIADSNFGIGVDIIESGFLNNLKFQLKKKFG